jgi:hypothetical protein
MQGFYKKAAQFWAAFSVLKLFYEDVSESQRSFPDSMIGLYMNLIF